VLVNQAGIPAERLVREQIVAIEEEVVIRCNENLARATEVAHAPIRRRIAELAAEAERLRNRTAGQ
jgi:fructose-bisphosphate aldolase class 1